MGTNQAFKRKSAEEARDLIEDLAKCNMKAPSKFSRGSSRGKGVMKLSKMTAMEAKLDAIMYRMDKQERKMHTAHEIGAVERELMEEVPDRILPETEVEHLRTSPTYPLSPKAPEQTPDQEEAPKSTEGTAEIVDMLKTMKKKMEERELQWERQQKIRE